MPTKPAKRKSTSRSKPTKRAKAAKNSATRAMRTKLTAKRRARANSVPVMPPLSGWTRYQSGKRTAYVLDLRTREYQIQPDVAGRTSGYIVAVTDDGPTRRLPYDGPGKHLGVDMYRSPQAALAAARRDYDRYIAEPQPHTMFCDETSSGWEDDGKGGQVYDCHCGQGSFPGEH